MPAFCTLLLALLSQNQRQHSDQCCGSDGHHMTGRQSIGLALIFRSDLCYRGCFGNLFLCACMSNQHQSGNGLYCNRAGSGTQRFRTGLLAADVNFPLALGQVDCGAFCLGIEYYDQVIVLTVGTGGNVEAGHIEFQIVQLGDMGGHFLRRSHAQGGMGSAEGDQALVVVVNGLIFCLVQIVPLQVVDRIGIVIAVVVKTAENQ